MSAAATFSLVKGEFNKLPFIAMISSQLRDYEQKDARPWFLGLSVPLTDPTGFPSNKEAADLNQFEDSISERLTAQCKHVFVGRVTWNGHRELLYYIDKPEHAVESLQKLIDSRTTRPFAFRCVPDPKWQETKLFLQKN